MRILFMSDLLAFYEDDLKRSFSELGLPLPTLSDETAEKVDEVEFIIYSPVQASDGTTVERDFSSYKNLRAVLSLYALSLIHISEPTRQEAISYGGVWV